MNANADAHIDSVKFSGGVIASLSLASSRIMRLSLDPEFSNLYDSDDPDVPTVIDFVVKPRSLYILSGPMRYHYTHEILNVPKTDMIDSEIEIGRRISIMLRDEK